MVEVPVDDSIEFALSILAALDSSPSHVGRCVSVQPLLSKHREKGGEEGDSKAGEEDCLDLNNRARRASPLWEGGNVVAKCGVIDLVDKDTEEGDGLVVRV